MNEEDEFLPSKSQRKRQSEAAQKIGEQLIELKPDELESIGLPDELIQAIQEIRKIKSRSAQKRQRQYIGKLMRDVDSEYMARQLKKIRHARDQNTAQFRRLEQWRDRLIKGDSEAMTELFDYFPDSDRQYINQLVRQAQKEQAQNKPPAAARKLFRYLSQLAEKRSL